MNKQNINTWLLHEEKRALKVYLVTFYITLVLYDFFYYYLYPKFILHKDPGFDSPLAYWNYVIIFGLIPVSYLLIKRGKQQAIKYIYITVYMLLTAISDIVLFSNEYSEYRSGNVAELILILFAPIFINKRFYWIASIVSIFRYLIVGVAIKSLTVVFPVVLLITFSVIAYIILNRFSSYIRALTSAYEELRHKEKLAFIGQMATAIGHEIRNPLASLKGFTQLQKEKYVQDQKYFSIMEQEIERIDLIVNDLLLLGKPRSTQFQKSNVQEIITYVISITQQLAIKKRISFSVEMNDSIPSIECVENQIKQVCMNLIKNGLDSMDDGGVLKIILKHDSRHTISISFIDQGCGINQTDMDKLFTPFYTTKEDGTGLGLIVTKKIIEDHQGKLKVESESNKGTKVEVILPIVQ
ncbi:ATP-binding protein [Cytobacillus sp. FJAT-53684]|uniref:histidine kinase n=1 Tax=Cytobacillus mangrovibacter TaxID=3299024 RepID=A0ABW6JZ97_9BACI